MPSAIQTLLPNTAARTRSAPQPDEPRGRDFFDVLRSARRPEPRPEDRTPSAPSRMKPAKDDAARAASETDRPQPASRDDQPVDESTHAEAPASDIAADEETATPVTDEQDEPAGEESVDEVPDASDAATVSTDAAALAAAVVAPEASRTVAIDPAGTSDGEVDGDAAQATDADGQPAAAAAKCGVTSKTNRFGSIVEPEGTTSAATGADPNAPQMPAATDAAGKVAPQQTPVDCEAPATLAPVAASASGDAETSADSNSQQGDAKKGDKPAAPVNQVATSPDGAAADSVAVKESSFHVTRADSAQANVAMTAPALQAPAPAHAASPALAATAPLTPQQFAQTNHPQIVTSVRGELLPNGGQMHIRLDPPELGALQVRVQMQNGAMVASFETSNDNATRLLSHSLSQLKSALEAQGVTVEKLQVQQSPREQHAQNEDGRQQQQQRNDDHPARQEQQRREMLRRMWRRLSMGDDPLDLVA